MATLGKEICASGSNKVGELLRVTAPLKEAGVSIKAVCAWADQGQARFLLVTENPDKAEGALKKAGFDTRQSEVVLVELQNKVGSLADAAQKLAAATIDIDHCFVSVSGSQALAVFATKDNQKALKVLG